MSGTTPGTNGAQPTPPAPDSAPTVPPAAPSIPTPAPSVPPPPWRARGKKKAALVITTALVVGAALGVGGYALFDDGPTPGPGPVPGPGPHPHPHPHPHPDVVTDDGPHRLEPPLTIGAYGIGAGDDDGGMTGADTPAEQAALGVEQADPVTASYEKVDGDKGVLMTFDALDGTIRDPAKTIDKSFDAAHRQQAKDASSPGAVVWLGSPHTVHPAGLINALMQCQEVEITEGAAKLDMPVCVWADRSTTAMVYGSDEPAAKTGKTVMDEGLVASFAVQLRDASRVPQ